MTHDELLALINKGELGWFYGWMQDALRAVVELHKPEFIEFHDVTYCNECTNNEIVNYPCPTIQAIEKELG